MSDLKDPRLIFLKGGLFLVLGVMAGSCLIARTPEWETAVLLGITVWAFCRLYYFMFYVIEHYVDRRYRFAGIGSFLRYWWTCRREDAERP